MSLFFRIFSTEWKTALLPIQKGDRNMEGWTEEEIRNKDLMAPCGLHCGTCGVYIATRDGREIQKHYGESLQDRTRGNGMSRLHAT
jgi:hypothetical protein